MTPRFPPGLDQTCPKSLDTASSTVVKLSEGGEQRLKSGRKKKLREKGNCEKKAAKTVSVSENGCFLNFLLALFLPTTNGFCEHCLL